MYMYYKLIKIYVYRIIPGELAAIVRFQKCIMKNMHKTRNRQIKILFNINNDTVIIGSLKFEIGRR